MIAPEFQPMFEARKKVLRFQRPRIWLAWLRKEWESHEDTIIWTCAVALMAMGSILFMATAVILWG